MRNYRIFVAATATVLGVACLSALGQDRERRDVGRRAATPPTGSVRNSGSTDRRVVERRVGTERSGGSDQRSRDAQPRTRDAQQGDRGRTTVSSDRDRREPQTGRDERGRVIVNSNRDDRRDNRHGDSHGEVRRGRDTITIIQPDHTRIRSIWRPSPDICRPVPRGTTVVRLPDRFRRVTVGGSVYFVNDGIYYSAGFRPDTYVVVRPPIGVRVSYLPSDYVQMIIGDRTYYYYDDCYYDTDLVVVDCPLGGVVYELPETRDTVIIEDEPYFRVSGAYYRSCLFEGRSAYLRVDVRF